MGHMTPKTYADYKEKATRYKPVPYADAITAISSGSSCNHRASTTQAANEYVKLDYRFKETERGPRECYLVTVPGIKFYAHTHTSKADAEKLAAQVAKTATGKLGKRRVKAQPILTKIEGN